MRSKAHSCLMLSGACLTFACLIERNPAYGSGEAAAPGSTSNDSRSTGVDPSGPSSTNSASESSGEASGSTSTASSGDETGSDTVEDPAVTFDWARTLASSMGGDDAVVRIHRQSTRAGSQYLVAVKLSGAAMLDDQTIADAAIAGLDETGSVVWVHHEDVSWGHSRMVDVAQGPNGELVVAHTFWLDVNFGTQDHTPQGSGDGLVQLLNPSRTTQWTAQWGSPNWDESKRIEAHPLDASILVLGSGDAGADFGQGPVVTSGWSNPVLASYDAGDGSVRWSRGVESNAAEFIALEASSNGWLVAGAMEPGGEATIFGTAVTGSFVSRLTLEGEPTWIVTIDDPSSTSSTTLSDITVGDGTVVATGTFRDRLAVDGRESFAVDGSEDVFVAAFDESDGSSLWVSSIGSSQNDRAGSLAHDVERNLVYGTATTAGALVVPDSAPDSTTASLVVAAHDMHTGAPVWLETFEISGLVDVRTVLFDQERDRIVLGANILGSIRVDPAEGNTIESSGTDTDVAVLALQLAL